MLKGILNSKITDKQFKIMFFTSSLFIILSGFLLLSFSYNILSKYKYYTNKQKIIVVDELGISSSKIIGETKYDIFNILAPKFVKELSSFDFKEKNNIYNYIKNNTTRKAYLKYEKFIKEYKWLIDTDLLNGLYSSTIEEYKIKNKKDSSYYFFKINVKFNSETIQKSYNLYIKLKIIEAQPNEFNKIGIYIDDIEVYKSSKEYNNFKKK